MKNMLLIEYLVNLLNLTYLKSNGKKINGDPCVQRLAELRCVRIFFFDISFKFGKNKGFRKNQID